MRLFKHPIRETINNYILRWNAFKTYLTKPEGDRGMIPLATREDWDEGDLIGYGRLGLL